MKNTIIKYCFLIIIAIFIVRIINQLQTPKIDLNEANTLTKWPNIDNKLFEENINHNINRSIYLYQGSGTNFCGFAVITYHLIKQNPVEYKRMITELYQFGYTTTSNGDILKPSKAILQYAGTIKNKGRLDISHADQLWFLTLADHYKGYVNLTNWSYDYGDESTTWASTNLNKFNRIWSSLTNKEITSRGSDLIRPNIDSYYNFIKEKQKDHTIMLYLNNTVLNKRDFSSITWPIPTHFVELYDLNPDGEYYVLEYWDYGFKTKEIIQKDKFNKLIYGISFTKK